MKPWNTLLAAALLLAGCGPTGSPTPTALPGAQPQHTLPALTAYHTRTPAAPTGPAPARTLAPAALPTLTPTPRTHTVARGEDLGGIAYRYQISLEALLAANPSVNPNAMSIGAVLVIPGSAPAGSTAAAALPTPDAQLRLGSPRCWPGASGVWCFVAAVNASAQDYESLQVRLALGDASGQNQQEQAAQPALDLLPAGQTLGFFAYFPGVAGADLLARATLESALPRRADDGRYRSASLEKEQIEIAPDGLSARVRGVVKVDGAPERVWLAVTAYTADGEICGLRRVEQVSAGKPFDAAVYSQGAPIARVVLQVEAR